MSRNPRNHCSFRWLILVIGAACTRDTGSKGIVVQDSAGVEIVQSAVPAWSQDPVWQLAPEPELSIGQAEAAPEYEFHEIAAAVRLPGGGVLVADAGFEYALRFFGPDGIHIKSVGSRGPGPDEFLRIGGIRRLGPDTLLITDEGQRRVSLLNLAGERIGALAYGQTESATPTGLQRLADGRWVGVINAFARMAEPPSLGIHRMEATLVSLAADGTGAGTIGTFPGLEVAFTDLGGGRSAQGLTPFGHTFAFAVAEAGIYVGTGDSLRFDLLSPDGRLLRSIRASGPDLTFRDQDIDVFRASMMAALPNDQARAAIDQYLTRVPRPEQKAAYTRILVDTEGNVWLGPTETPFESIGPWHVFAASGQYLGELAIPERLHVLEVDSDYVLGQWRDDMGVESIRIYRLAKE